MKLSKLIVFFLLVCALPVDARWNFAAYDDQANQSYRYSLINSASVFFDLFTGSMLLNTERPASWSQQVGFCENSFGNLTSMSELQSILDYVAESPWPASWSVSSNLLGDYWTSDSTEWTVGFFANRSLRKTQAIGQGSYYGICRTAAANLKISKLRYTDEFENPISNESLYVLDRKTSLLWSREVNPCLEQSYADTACRSLGDSWHLPTVKELMTLVDYDRSNPSLNTAVFSTPSAYYTHYWTSTGLSKDGDNYAVVSFTDGSINDVSSNYSSCVGPDCCIFARCVKRVNRWENASYEDATNQTMRFNVFNSFGSAAPNPVLPSLIVDTSNWLFWRGLAHSALSHQDAESACRNATWGAHVDWRLPTVSELLSTFDYTLGKLAFPFPFLSNSLLASESHLSSPIGYWTMDTSDGTTGSILNTSSAGLLCVRGENRTVGENKYTNVYGGPILSNTTRVRDSKTGFIWARGVLLNEPCSADTTASLACRQTYGQGWRSPTIKELATLIDYTSEIGINETLFPGADYFSNWCSSSIDSAGNSLVVAFGSQGGGGEIKIVSAQSPVPGVRTCVRFETECTQDLDCQNTTNHYCVEGLCSGCRTNGDCDDGLECRDNNQCCGTCDEITPYCYQRNCLECLVDADCESGFCSEGMCKICHLSSQCPDDKPHCNRLGECQQCPVTVPCVTGQICGPRGTRPCAECLSDADCRGFCGKSLAYCNNYQCAATCEHSSQCYDVCGVNAPLCAYSSCLAGTPL
ncbi:MAG: DUF1566 domain-containing protein [Myxococcaceae bacterium]|nr:DUF1566 domain-containing protein [Myxococcaceae bacterium]MBH2005863.1 DUF1566 domain-containing protein [Myxococcaceae bacterium]